MVFGDPVAAGATGLAGPGLPGPGGLHSRSSPAGVRMISLSYSRISLADIAQKLQLDSPEDAEFIVAKVAAHDVLGCPQPPFLAPLPGCLCPVPAALPPRDSRWF